MAAQREVVDPRGDIILRLRRHVQLAPAEPKRQKTAATEALVAEATPLADNTDIAQDPELAAEPLDIVVSSNVLCLVSPVFKALLTGPFRESSEFAAASAHNSKKAVRQGGPSSASIIGCPAAETEASLSPNSGSGSSSGEPDVLYTLELPEDDCDAMLTLMNMAHFRPCSAFPSEETSSDTSVPGAILLGKLAVLCDKYQCPGLLVVGVQWVQAVHTHLQKTQLEIYLAIRKRNPNYANTYLVHYLANCCRLLVFCWVADLPDTFSALCSDIVKYHVGPITSFAGPSEQASGTKRPRDETLPSTILGHVLLPKFLAGKKRSW